MGVYIPKMEMPINCSSCPLSVLSENRLFCERTSRAVVRAKIDRNCPLIEIPPHGRLKRRVVYRGEVYNALESARINALDGILTDRYKDGFHDGLKRALEILANEVQDAPTIIPKEE